MSPRRTLSHRRTRLPKTQHLLHLIAGTLTVLFLIYMYRGCRTPRGGNLKALARDPKGKMRWSKSRDKESGKQKIVWQTDDVSAFVAKEEALKHIAEGFVVEKDPKKEGVGGEPVEGEEIAVVGEEDEAGRVTGEPVNLSKQLDRFYSMESLDVGDEGDDVAAVVPAGPGAKLKAALEEIDIDDSLLYPVPPDCLACGENVEYFSSTYQLFLPAKIVAHNRKTGTCSVTLSARLSGQTRNNVHRFL